MSWPYQKSISRREIKFNPHHSLLKFALCWGYYILRTEVKVLLYCSSNADLSKRITITFTKTNTLNKYRRKIRCPSWIVNRIKTDEFFKESSISSILRDLHRSEFTQVSFEIIIARRQSVYSWAIRVFYYFFIIKVKLYYKPWEFFITKVYFQINNYKL